MAPGERLELSTL